MKTNFTPTLQFLALAGWLSLFLMGCTDSSKSPQQTDLTTSALVSNFNVNLHPMNKIVCDPFAGQAQISPVYLPKPAASRAVPSGARRGVHRHQQDLRRALPNPGPEGAMSGTIATTHQFCSSL